MIRRHRPRHAHWLLCGCSLVAAALLASGCGGRTALISTVAPNATGGVGGEGGATGGFGGSRDAGTGGSSDVGTGSTVPDTGAGGTTRPEVGSDGSSGGTSGKPDTGAGGAPDAGSAERPEVGTNDLGTEARRDLGSGDLADAGRDSPLDSGPDAALDGKAEVETDGRSDGSIPDGRDASEAGAGGGVVETQPRFEGDGATNQLLVAASEAQFRDIEPLIEKYKAGAVEINGERVTELALANPADELVIQAGKNWRRVTI